MADRTHSERINFGKLREVIQPPNLIEIQITSYLDFLQKGVPEKQRKPQGLEAVFREVFPILSYDERLTLELWHQQRHEHGIALKLRLHSKRKCPKKTNDCNVWHGTKCAQLR